MMFPQNTCRAQRACCAHLRSAQHFWGPLGADILLRAWPKRATRVLRAVRRPLELTN